MKRFNEKMLAIASGAGILTAFGSLLLGVQLETTLIFSAVVATGILGVQTLIEQSNRKFLKRNLSILSACVLLAVVLIPSVRARFSVSVDNFGYSQFFVVEAESTHTDGSSYVTASGGEITVSAKGYTTEGIGGQCGSDEADTVNVTLTAQSDVTYNLSVGSNVTGVSSGTGLELKKGGTITFSVASGKGDSSAAVVGKVTLSDVKAVSTGVDVTTKFKPGTGGNFHVDSAKIETETALTKSSDHEYTITATASEGYDFYCWMSSLSGKLTGGATTTYIALEGKQDVVWPVFRKKGTDTLPQSAVYYIKEDTPSIYYSHLDEAIAAAGSSKTIVVAEDGTVYNKSGESNGSYTIPSGVTLLIPRDAANTVDTTQPNKTEPTKFGNTPPAPTSFRKLTMANGASIAVNGSVNIGGTQWAGGKYISVTGATGFIQMNSGSSITVNNGGSLHAWGYITGSGSVTAKSGATVYEQFQVGGWRGGDMTSTMIYDTTHAIFPMSQYYVQNIEVPLTLESGATEVAFASADISMAGLTPISVPFVGIENNMFKITSGYVVKDYIESADRLEIKVYGDVSLTPVEISMKLSVLGSITLKSKDFELPINHNMTIHAVSGSMLINQDVAILPGAQIIVDEGVTCTLGEGVSMYAYDADQWDTYCGSVNAKLIPVAHAPGRPSTLDRTKVALTDAAICINGTVDASKGYLYTTAGKANVYSTGSGVVKAQAGTQTVTYQVKQADPVDKSTYVEIPITSAMLKNANDTYVQSATGTYTYTDGAWICQHTAYDSGKITTVATCTTDGVKTFTCTGCADSYTESIPALGHTAGAAADCENAQTCTVCGAQLQAALGHNWSGATCTAPKTCSRCGATEGTALGHDFSSTTGECSSCDESREALVLVENVAEGTYCSIADAVAVSEETNDVTIRLFVNYEIAEPFDLGGREFEVSNKAQITIVEGGSVYDSHTDGYDATKAGSITLASTDGVYTYGAKHYAAIDNGKGNYSFHRIGVSLTAARLDIYQRDIYLSVEATIRGTDAGLDALSAIGFDFGNSVTAKLNKNAGEGEPKLDTDTREERTNETTGVISYQIYGSYTMQLTKESPETYEALAQLFYGDTPAKSVSRTIAWMDALNGIAADNTAVANALAKLAEGGA